MNGEGKDGLSGASAGSRGPLWVTRTGFILHQTATCCRGVWNNGRPNGWGHREQVKDHAVPEFFDQPQFTLCPEVVRVRKENEESHE